MSALSMEAQRSGKPIEALSRDFSADGLFWLEPEAVQKVDELINKTRLSTMSLAAKTLAENTQEARAQLRDALIYDDDPLANELERAMNIGFVYGGLVAKESSNNEAGDVAVTVRQLPASLIEGFASAKEGLDLASDRDNYGFFVRLRNIELEHTGSDVLAFGLASTQDHMGSQFDRYHDGSQHLSAQETRRLQSIYYAGALAGAMHESEMTNLNKPNIEIMRSMDAGDDAVSVRLELESGDNLSEAIDLALSTKLNFSHHVDANDRPYIAVIPAGVQFGPNVLSMPIYAPGFSDTNKVMRLPADEVAALIIEEEAGKDKKFSLVDDVEDYLSDHKNNPKIVGVIDGDVCAGSYDRAHPNSEVLRELAARFYNSTTESVEYVDGLVIEEDTSRANVPISAKRLGALTLAGIGAAMAPDTIGKMAGVTEANPKIGIVASGIVLLGAAAYYAAARVYRSISDSAEQTIKNLDAIDQQRLDQITLER